ncbi:MAG: hypothetical protein JST76_14595 [Bacteroidetes bacterium]|nr:hypothetical protein [Bacteroidota bacterium]
MKKTDRLHELIRSLTRNEKGYFKKFSFIYSKEENAGYISLFDAIDRQTEYDEAALLRKFAKGKTNYNLSTAKAFLYDRILKSLEAYHAARPVAEVRSCLNQYEILVQKILHAQAEKVLDRAEHLAQKHELTELMPDILIKRIALWKVRKFQDVRPEDVEGAISRLAANLKNTYDLASVYRFQSQYDHLYTSRGTLADAAHKAAFESFIRAYENSGISSCESFPVQVAYLLLLHSMCNFTDQVEKGYKANQKLLLLFEQDPARVENRRHQYHHALARMVESQTGLRLYGEAAHHLEKLKKSALPSTSGADIPYWSYYTLLLEVMLLRSAHDFAGLRRIIDQSLIPANFRLFESRNYDIQIKLQAAMIYFYHGDYSRVSDMLNEMLNNPRNGVRPDFYCYAKLLLTITYWEMGYQALVLPEVKSTRSFFESKLSLLPADKLILRFIEKHHDIASSSRRLLPAFDKLRSELLDSYTEPMNKRHLGYIDVGIWIDIKLQQKPIPQTVSPLAF